MSGFDREFRLSKDVTPSRYQLRFDLDLDSWTAKGWERIALRTAKATREIVIHAVELEIGKAAIDGTNALEGQKTEAEAQVVVLRFAKEIPAGEHTLEIEWTGTAIRCSVLRPGARESCYAATQVLSGRPRACVP